MPTGYRINQSGSMGLNYCIRPRKMTNLNRIQIVHSKVLRTISKAQFYMSPTKRYIDLKTLTVKETVREWYKIK